MEPGLVAGVGVQRVKTLNQHGIYTAQDIARKSLGRVSGVGDKIIRDLLAWRSGIEKAAQASIPAFSVNQQIRADAAAELWMLHTQLTEGQRLLQIASTEGTNNYQQAQADIEALLQQREALLKQLQSEKI